MEDVSEGAVPCFASPRPESERLSWRRRDKKRGRKEEEYERKRAS